MLQMLVNDMRAAKLKTLAQGQDEDGYELAGSMLRYRAPSSTQRLLTSFKLLRARPWRRFKKGSVLVLKVELLLGPCTCLQTALNELNHKKIEDAEQ